MTEKDLTTLKRWFSDYSQSFYSSNNEDQKNIVLKVDHTHNVCKNIVAIAKSLSLDDHTMRLAETVALFHDIGRFPQYARYKTFRDADSENHGLLGAKTLIGEKVLGNLSDKEGELIINAVKFHNAFAIPTVLKGDILLLLKLIRDADKVDIYRIFIDYYESPEEDRASATAFGVPATPEYSEVMLSCILKKQVAAYSNIRTENDFKLMKLSWVYDMHFDESIRLLNKSDSFRKLISRLPQTDEIRSAMTVLRLYISERTGNGE